ncbi:MAG: sensor domain-containing diguanylate cyclase [Actinobacteria bacterium]|nr:MAG: sensor domain-containing diguanylate cyclase [Actinomycetota bacterium]
MGVLSRKDAATGPEDWEAVLAGVRRLTVLADGSHDHEAIFRALAAELLSVPEAEEVHVHHLAPESEEEQVSVYMFEGNGRLSYMLPRGERPPGVSWVASSGRCLHLAEDAELARSAPRLTQTGVASAALLLPLVLRSEVESVVMLVRRRDDPFTERSLELARPLVEQAGTALALLHARTEAGTDAVAGCMNHRAMRRRLDEEIGRATRAGTPLSCLLIDLDNFKLVNDEHGHQAGDAVLREVVSALVGEFRAFDRVARYGGDEFVVIMPNADLRSAAAAANRALERLNSLPGLGDEPGVPASIGVAQWHAPMTTEELLSACDAALLRSKREGKGRVRGALGPPL